MTDRSEPTTAAARAMVTVAAVDYYMDHWGVPTMKRAGIMQDLHEEAKVEVEAEARQPDSEALRRVVANLTKSLLIAQDGESVSGGTAAVLWLRDVITLAALPPKGEAIDSGEGRVVPSLGDFSTPPLPRSPSDPPTASDLRGLVTDPAWGEGHRASGPPALDVERLAEAMAGILWNPPDPLYNARHVATWYARLSAQPEAQPAEDADAE